MSGTVPEALLLLIQGGLPCIRLARLPRRLARLPRRHNMPSVRHAIQRHADRGPTTRAPQEQAAARDALRGRCGDNEHHSLRDTPAARPRPECALSSELARGDRLGFITKSTETQEDSHTGAGSSLAPKAIVTYDAVVPILQLIAPSRFCNLDVMRQMVHLWQRRLRRVWQSMSAVAARWPRDPMSCPRLGWAALRPLRIVHVR